MSRLYYLSVRSREVDPHFSNREMIQFLKRLVLGNSEGVNTDVFDPENDSDLNRSAGLLLNFGRKLTFRGVHRKNYSVIVVILWRLQPLETIGFE